MIDHTSAGATPELTYVRSVSTRAYEKPVKIRRPRQGRSGQRRKAPPLGLKRLRSGWEAVPISLSVVIHSEVYIRVEYTHGVFWVKHDASLYDLLEVIRRGGHWIQDS